LLGCLGTFSEFDFFDQTLKVQTADSTYRPLIEAALQATPDWFALDEV